MQIHIQTIKALINRHILDNVSCRPTRQFYEVIGRAVYRIVSA